MMEGGEKETNRPLVPEWFYRNYDGLDDAGMRTRGLILPIIVAVSLGVLFWQAVIAAGSL
jgi:hypothetical protein